MSQHRHKRPRLRKIEKPVLQIRTDISDEELDVSRFYRDVKRINWVKYSKMYRYTPYRKVYCKLSKTFKCDCDACLPCENEGRLSAYFSHGNHPFTKTVIERPESVFDYMANEQIDNLIRDLKLYLNTYESLV